MEMDHLEGTPALLYTALWQTVELGFLKNLCEENKIENLNILLFFNDYKPGALLTIDGLKGHFFIKSLDSIEEAGDLKQYSNLGLLTGDIGPIIKAMGSGHFIRKMFMNMITRNRSVKFKGIGNLIKFGKLLLGGAL